ncbi:ABC transporter substrate-binding protein [Clostridium zeae]|uniref:ABC transporter substrate-binding protein n=1 Tax=Clostridium zeae TaxID=2759022 RepID=A0ABQ1ECE7_9CLOT|nr:ABC transporter substrate-binding protein [Clostridium zeae]GFZ32477.1 ABC transporter substrate-binding protein [Clostridium zeae]
MKRKLSKLLILVIVVVTLQGCTNIIQKNNNIVDNNSITYAVEKFPDSINITNKLSLRDKDLIYSIFDGLVSENENGDIVPDLAESYSVSKDGLEYVFKLRNDIYWSNGNRITADDFMKFFKSITSNKNKDEYVSELYNVYGVKDYHEGKGTFEKNVAISKEDGNVVKFRMNVRDDSFLKKLSEGYFKLREFDDNLDNYKQKFASIKYSGAYAIKNINEDKEIELDLNEKYWNKKSTNAKKIILKVFTGAELALADFESKKDVDIILNIPNSEISRLSSKNLVEIFPNDTMKVVEFNPDTKNNKTNLSMRRALEKSILNTITGNSLVKEDRFQLALGELERKALKSNESIVSSTVTNDSKNLDSIKEQVSNLLSKSSYEGDALRLVCLKSDENKSICEFISKNLKDIYNITVKYNLLDQNQLKKAVSTGDYELLLEDITSSSDTYGQLVNKWIVNNKGKAIDNKDINDMISTSTLKKDETVDSKNKNIVKLLRDNNYIVPLLFDNLICVKSDKVKNITFSKDGILSLNQLEVNDTN